MKKLLILNLLLAPFILGAQVTEIGLQNYIDSLGNQPFNQIIIDSLKDRGEYNMKLKDGYWVEYVIDSTLLPRSITLIKKEGLYKNGKREDVWKYYKCYSKDFPLHWDFQETYEYKNGLFHGYWRHYQVTGKIIYEQEYAYGEKDGYYKEFLYSDKPNKLFPYLNDTLNGILKTYYADGALKTEEQVLKGKSNGAFREYFQNGKVQRELTYKNDTLQGEERVYNETGTLITKANIKGGEYHGSWVYYYDNGNEWTERIYKDGKLVTVRFIKTLNGQNLDIGTFKNGSGTIKIYSTDGKLTEEWIYENGLFKSKTLHNTVYSK